MGPMTMPETTPFKEIAYPISQWGWVGWIRPERDLSSPRVRRTLDRWAQRSRPGIIPGPWAAREAPIGGDPLNGSYRAVGRRRYFRRVRVAFTCCALVDVAPEHQDSARQLLATYGHSRHAIRFPVMEPLPVSAF